MLSYIQHPLIDVGVATIVAFAEKSSPFDLADSDLRAMAMFMAREYPKPPYKSFLSIAFTSNAWFIQDAYNPDKPNLSDEKREEIQRTRDKWADYHLMQWLPDLSRHVSEFDIFTGLPAVGVALSGKLKAGRAGRAQIPLVAGDESINFYAYGSPGIPIAGTSLLCLQAMPLGCAKCGGRLLLVHSDNQELMQHFARHFLQENRKAVHLARESDSSKMPEPHFAMRTLFLYTLLEAEEMRRESLQDERPFSVTIYHFSNSGQGVDLKIYHFPIPVIAFLRDMNSADFAHEWNRLVGRAWELPPKKKGKAADDEPFQPSKNWLYEDLFDLQLDLAQNARRFIRTYFLRFALRYARGETDPRGGYSLQAESELVSWKITAQFLRRILNMDKERVEQIRKMGDQLAQYIAEENDRRFFTRFYAARTYYDLRLELIRANTEYVKRGHAPIITLDPYIGVFEEGDELARTDWRLSRDLVLIRIVERLHGLGWLGKNEDILAAAEETKEKNEAENDGVFR